jgi:acetoin utilization deacetylase AcuC-like enzyme
VDPRPLVVRDQRLREHASPGHPERPQRLDAIDRALEPLAARVRDLEASLATDDEILRAHTRDHLELLRSIEGRRAQLDPDTYCSPRSLEIARLAAGGTVDAARRVARGEASSAFALVRPPGHHAERAHAMGFCLFNNVAIAARSLLEEEGLERIAILDWDVHHGNGTQHAFESERDVLFVSLHQFPLYPGTGAMAEVGRDAGEGATVNLPLPPGCGDEEYGALFEGLVEPILAEFRPQIILVSAGFDAHERDPLASMCLTSAGYAALAARTRAVAESVCEGRLVLALEGGYELDALGESVRSVIDVLGADTPPVAARPHLGPEIRALVGSFRDLHGRYWRSVGRSISSA